MTANYTAHILSHTHWDREWYLNSPYTNEWLIPFFDELFRMLDKEPEYKFILDGQLSMIEDYFEELSKCGRSVSTAKRLIKQHVQRKTLFIGPYYLQPDWQLLSEESLVRNLLVGKKLADSLGGSMTSGWLLDNFGQISQTCQIHKLAGLKGLFVWRGVAMNPRNVTSEFLWESPDGTQLLSVYLLNSYRNVMRLAEYSDIMKTRMDEEVSKLKPFATTKNLLMMNGYDQEMFPDDIQPYLRNGNLNGKDYTSVQSDPDSYIKAIKNQHPNLPILSGALYNGRFISVFPGVLSSRMYLKIQNDKSEKLLEKQLEPLSFMAWSLGDEYGGSQIEQAWKLLLKNHPHDNICGVSIDNVHQDMEARSRQVYTLAYSLLEEKASYLAGIIDTTTSPNDEAVIVFNSSPYKRPGIIEYQGQTFFVEDIPALGYKLVCGSDQPEFPLKVDGMNVENKFLHFRLNGNGSFNLQYKATKRSYKQLGILEDMGDSGDEYNYSYPDKDQRLTTENATADIQCIHSTPWKVTFRVELVLDLPKSDTNQHRERSQVTRPLPVVTYISIESHSPVVKCRTLLRNTVRDHRMRVLFPTGFDAESSYAGSPFDITERPVHIPDYDESDIPGHVKKVIIGARETKPSTYFHTREMVDLNNGDEGLAVFNKGLPEYQVRDNGTIALTLFRSVGWIAKEINTRIGDAGPEIFTPDAQCLREMEFEYAVCPHTGDAYSGISRLADDFNNNLMVVTTSKTPGSLPPEKSWLEIDDSNQCIKITAVKRSEDSKGFILRGVNLSAKGARVSVSADLKVKKAELVNLLESTTSILQPRNQQIEFEVKSKQIFTLKLTIERQAPSNFHKPDVLMEIGEYVEDFSSFPYADYVTDVDIDNEKARAETLLQKIDDPLHRRTALEAQLSLILAKHRQDEKTIRSLGYQLNEARVQRRIHDYLSTTMTKKD